MAESTFPPLSGTFFAPPGRATPAEVREQASLCLDDPVLHAVLEAVDSYAVVLNEQRQILAANPVLLEALSREAADSMLGKRLGESLGCVHVPEAPGGCGTSKACRHCGAVLAMLAAQGSEEPVTGECRLSLQLDGKWTAQEFAIRAMPLCVAGHRFTLITLRDVSALKRRDALERIFLHDLMNTLQGLRGYTDLLQAAGAEPSLLAGRILDLASHLTDEVAAQRRLLMAEAGELRPDIQPAHPEHILDELGLALGAEAAARLLRPPSPAQAQPVSTDRTILVRILTNMVLNALEAMPQGGQARVWFEQGPEATRFIVQNPGCMPDEVADQVFQRSFSTKASQGRGLGTYAMKLLGESILGAKVGFITSWEEGTLFHIEIPHGA